MVLPDGQEKNTQPAFRKNEGYTLLKGMSGPCRKAAWERFLKMHFPAVFPCRIIFFGKIHVPFPAI